MTHLCSAYKSSAKETNGLTPFEVVFRRDPIIRIDLIYPNQLEFTREPILENHTVQRSKIGPVTINTNETFEKIDIFKDNSAEEVVPKCPAPIKRYIEEKRDRFQTSFEFLNRH